MLQRVELEDLHTHGDRYSATVGLLALAGPYDRVKSNE